MFQKGQLIKYKSKRHKRIWFQVGDERSNNNEIAYDLFPIYKPVSKSTLRNKSYFTKVKRRTVKW